eukprot:5027787-Prymnesium_polylepis.1
MQTRAARVRREVTQNLPKRHAPCDAQFVGCSSGGKEDTDAPPPWPHRLVYTPTTRLVKQSLHHVWVSVGVGSSMMQGCHSEQVARARVRTRLQQHLHGRQLVRAEASSQSKWRLSIAVGALQVPSRKAFEPAFNHLSFPG